MRPHIYMILLSGDGLFHFLTGWFFCWLEDLIILLNAFNTMLEIEKFHRNLHKMSLVSFKLKPTHYLLVPSIRWLDTKSILHNPLKNSQLSEIVGFIRIVFTNAGGKEKSYWHHVFPTVRDMDSWMSEGSQHSHVHIRSQTVFGDLFSYWISFSYLHLTDILGKSSVDLIPGSLPGQMLLLNNISAVVTPNGAV